MFRRAEHGLAPIGCSINEFTGRLPLHLVGNVPDLDYNRRDLPASVHYLGPCSEHPADPGRTTEWLEALPPEGVGRVAERLKQIVLEALCTPA
jgi:hypothetical protein